MDFTSPSLALTARDLPNTFTNLKDLARFVASKAEELSGHDDVYQYISLNHVTERDFGYIGRKRHQGDSPWTNDLIRPGSGRS